MRRRENMRLVQAIEQYEDRIKNLGQAPASIYTAHYALERFRKSVAGRQNRNPYLHDITSADMDEYCYGPHGIRRGVAAVTFNRYRSVLKMFFEWALLKGWIDTNPMEAIDRARPDVPKSRLLLSASELLILLDNCTNPIQRMACALGMNTGLRGNDIRHLTLLDANLINGTIQTEIRKTRKFDVKPITMDLRWELTKWLNTYAGLMGMDSAADLPGDFLLVPAYRTPGNFGKGERLPIRPMPHNVHTNPWRMVQRPLAAMGYPTYGEGFHTLRRSSARALFECLRNKGEGRDHALMIVKDYLNHSSVVQTEHYLGLSQERTMRDALLKDQPFLSALAETEQARINERDTRQHGT